MRIISTYLMIATIIVAIAGCKKDAGAGGTSTIKGKVLGKYYNKTFTVFNGAAYAPNEDVYIIYGAETTYGNKVKTLYDGSYEFKYLRKGDYKIFTYGKDSAVHTITGIITVSANAQVTANKQTVEVADMVIIR